MISFINKVTRLRFLWKVALIVLVIIIGVGVSFLLTREITYRTFADRLTWGGIISILVAGMGVISLAGLNRGLNLPDVIVKKEEAKRLMDSHQELRESIEKRYDFCLLFFLVGIGCIAIGAIIQVIGANLWPAV
jgi:hypothetical protein